MRLNLMRIFGITALGAALVFAAATPQKKEGGKSTAKKSSNKKAAAKPAGDKEKGEEIYRANCAVCHYADKTDKRIGPGLAGLFKREKMENGKPINDANVREIIMEGYEKMIPFKDKLDDKQLADLIAYLHTL